MVELTWHLERAKVVLNEWYERMDNSLFAENFFMNLTIPRRALAYNSARIALHCKTAGLVWHDRYKMLLDCQRSHMPLDDI